MPVCNHGDVHYKGLRKAEVNISLANVGKKAYKVQEEGGSE